jgi:beta-glucosidase
LPNPHDPNLQRKEHELMTESLLPYQDASLPIRQRVDDLLARMNRAEKISQLTQMFILPENREQAKALIRQHGLGSRILATTNLAGTVQEKSMAVDDLNELQKVAVEESRLGIPLLHGRDVIHGYRTIFPIPLAMAATWEPALVEEAFAAAASEASSAGVHWSFAPMLDIARDPRWGRIIEGYGEDPYLAAQLAEASVVGFQGRSAADSTLVIDEGHMLACAKHYIGYGGAEGGRDYNTAEITPTTLKNIYLPPFQAAVKAGVATVMSGFHDLNGESVSGSHTLLTELLKEELGFDGFIISDWGSVSDLIFHRLAGDRKEAARIAFNAGVDMDMCAQCYLDHLEALVEAGEVSEQRLDDAVRRVLWAKFRAGLFERPYADAQKMVKAQFTTENQALARRAAARSMVLLQNNNQLLPLPRSLKKITVIGPLAQERRALLGSWVLDARTEETQTVLEAFREILPELTITAPETGLFDEMLIDTLDADVVVLVVGESNLRNGENQSTASIDLPPGQEELIEAVASMGKPVVLVVLAGRPVNLSRASRFADAILYAWHPGSLGGKAILDVLFGDAEPVGRLPVTFPRATGQVPMYYNHKSTGKTFARYVDIPITPLYPFGYGLGYTTFEYSEIRVDRDKIQPGETVTVSALVTNTGSRAGETVAQCYVQDVVASITRPVRELKGFARVRLSPGESQRVSFPLSPEAMSFYDLNGKWQCEPGDFLVWVGGDSQAALETGFRLKK